VDDISDYCNVCGADIRRPAPLTPVRETPRPSPEKPGPAPLTPSRVPPQPSPERTGPGTPVAGIPGDGKNVPVQEKRRRPLGKWGIGAAVAVIVLVVIAAFISGMIPGIGQSPDTTPAAGDQDSLTTHPTQTPAPVLTTVPATVITTPVPTEITNVSTTIKTNASTSVNTNASTTVKTNTSTTVNTNASTTVKTNTSTTVKPNVSVTISSQPYMIGQSATDGKAKVTVNSYTFKDKLSDPIPSYAIGKKYLIVEITYENLQNVTVDVDTSTMFVKDGGGYTFETASDGMLENPFYVYGKTIPALEKRTGNMVYIVPPGATLLKFQYNFGKSGIATFQLT